MESADQPREAREEVEDSVVATLNELLDALGHPTRRKVLRAVADRWRSATYLADLTRVPKPTMSHHLKVLKHAGILVRGRAGAKCELEELERRLYEALKAIHPFGVEAVSFITESGEEVRTWR